MNLKYLKIITKNLFSFHNTIINVNKEGENNE